MLSALAFLTVAGGARTPDARTLRWFPLIGAGIGGLLAVVWVAGDTVWNPAVAAALVIAADLAITGMLHFDGLADSADGLLPHFDRDRRLEVMAAPDVGAFALAVVPAALLLRWVALAGGAIEPLALIGIWAASRTLMAVTPAFVPYARASGLASPFIAGAKRWILLYLFPIGAVLAATNAAAGTGVLLAGLAAGSGVVLLGRRRLGGFTGDVLGAAAVVAETVMLLGLAT